MSTVDQLVPYLREICFCAGFALAIVSFPLYHLVLDQRD